MEQITLNKTYLCGGINGLNDADCRDWREVAKLLLTTDTLDPMRRDYRGKEDESVADIIAGGLSDILASEYCVVNATCPSWGTGMEIVYANRFGLYIVAFAGDAKISPWLRWHCNSIVGTVEQACVAINEKAKQ